MGDSPILTKLREGDDQTFRQLVKTYQNKVYNTAIEIATKEQKKALESAIQKQKIRVK